MPRLAVHFGKSCPKHEELRGERQNSSGKCVACVRERARLWRSRNRDKDNERARQRYAANPAKKLAANLEYDRKNPESLKRRKAKWYRAHPEKAKSWRPENREKHRQRVRRWEQNNPDKHDAIRRRWYKENKPKHNAKIARRRAREREAMPPSAPAEDKARIEVMYRQAKERGLTVDHIIPLAGCRRCGAKGIHEPGNLQLMPSGENKAKRDRCQDCWDQLRSMATAKAA